MPRALVYAHHDHDGVFDPHVVTALRSYRPFIDQIVASEQQRTLVRTILAMADTMKLLVVAEGIEDAAQLDLMTSMHCGYGQGYIFSKPLPAEAATAWLRQNLAQ